MGYRHQRIDIVDAAVRVVLGSGIGGLTYAAVATELGTNDRTVVYYLPTKQALLTEALVALGDRLRDLLDDALGDRRMPADAVLRRVWRALATPDADPVVAVYVELLGRAARPGGGERLERDVAQAVSRDWLEWIGERISGPGRHRRRDALGILAQLDGLLLLRQVLGPEAADLAAASLDSSSTERPSNL
jgi:AcrR family transcriptional regulator